MTHDFQTHGRAARIAGLQGATLVALLMGGLSLAGCATGRSVQDTVSGWFHRDDAQAPAASKSPAQAPAKRKTPAPVVDTAPPEAGPDAAATGAAPEASTEGEAPATPEEPKPPEPSIFDPY